MTDTPEVKELEDLSQQSQAYPKSWRESLVDTPFTTNTSIPTAAPQVSAIADL